MSKARDIADLGSNDVLETSSTGVDVTGTVTADGLTSNGDITVDTENAELKLIDTSSGNTTSILSNNFDTSISADGRMFLRSGGTSNAIQIGATGDVSFYEDTGTTAKMVWDASAESLGIGTASPNDTLDVNGSNTVNPNSTGSEITSATIGLGSNIHLEERQVNGAYSDRTDLAIVTNTGFGQGESEKIRIAASGNVGIGTDSPARKTHIYDSTNAGLRMDGGVNGGYVEFKNGSSADMAYIGNEKSIVGTGSTENLMLYTSGAAEITMRTSGTERARIDSSGNLLVGTTTSPTNNLSSGNVVGDIFSSSSHTVSDVGSTFVDSGFSVGNTRASYLVTISGGAPNNGSALATYIFTKAAYDAELVQLGNTASHYGNVSIEAQRSSSSSSTVNLQVRFTGVNLTGTGPITTNAIRIG